MGEKISGTLRIAFLWSRLPAYAYACINELSRSLQGNIWYASLGELPSYLNKSRSIDSINIKVFPRSGNMRETAGIILKQLQIFKPQVVIVSGWNMAITRFVVKRLKTQGVLTVCMTDTPWLGTLRQFTRSIIGKQLLRRYYDVMWVPGAQAIPLARFLGFKDSNIWQNLYSCDTKIFTVFTETRLEEAKINRNWPRKFLFVGRLSEEKNITGLINAYKKYCSKIEDSWGLTMIGDGPFRKLAENTNGVECLGWREPEYVAKIMAESGCLILPSKHDPWGIVMHEAASSGLPLIASWNVGATAELLCDGYNGRFVNAQDIDDIVNALSWITMHHEPWLLGERSYNLSKQFSPILWAKYSVQKICEKILI